MENSTISNFRNELILRKKNKHPIHFGNVETDPRLLWYTLTFSMGKDLTSGYHRVK